MTKRRLAFAAWTLLSFLPVLRADEISNNLQAQLTEPLLDAFAKDAGALLAGGSFHSGDTLSFPVGFDVGVHFAGVGVKDENGILRDDDSFATAGWAQVEAGLPAKLNLIARFGKLYDADIIGGGLRWGIIDSDVPGLPSISISALYHHLDHDFIEGQTISANLALSFDVPIIHPYIGVGYDTTKVEPTSRAFDGVAPTVDRGLEGDASGYRIEAGVNLSLFPFTYVTLGGGLANGEKMGHAGLGVRF